MTNIKNKKELLNEEQKKLENIYGTRLPNKIGRKHKQDDDGKIRDSAGNVMG